MIFLKKIFLCTLARNQQDVSVVVVSPTNSIRYYYLDDQLLLSLFYVLPLMDQKIPFFPVDGAVAVDGVGGQHV